MLTLDQLRTVQAIARTGSFSRAGRELFLTQPAISKRVREIEAIFGVELFHRARGRRGGLQLTEAGERVLKFAQDMLDAYDRLCTDVGDSEQMHSKLTVAVTGPYPASRIVSTLFHGLANQPRPVQIDLTIIEDHTIVDAIRTSRVDMGVVAAPAVDDSLTWVPVWCDQWIIAVAPDHSLSDTWGYPRRCTDPIPIIVPSRGTHIRSLINRWAASSGLTFDPILESRFMDPLKSALLESVAPGWTPRHLVAEDLAQGRLLSLPWEGLPVLSPLVLAISPEYARSPTVQHLLKHVLGTAWN